MLCETIALRNKLSIFENFIVASIRNLFREGRDGKVYPIGDGFHDRWHGRRI